MLHIHETNSLRNLFPSKHYSIACHSKTNHKRFSNDSENL
jgi:hypothetical protein